MSPMLAEGDDGAACMTAVTGEVCAEAARQWKAWPMHARAEGSGEHTEDYVCFCSHGRASGFLLGCPR